VICPACATQLPDDAEFCLRCGRPQRAAPQNETEAWEHCHVTCVPVADPRLFASWLSSQNWFRCARFRFRAESSGPTGTSTTAESPVFQSQPDAPPAADDPAAVAAHNVLVRALLDQGWQPFVAPRTEWYDLAFRRRRVVSLQE
jgi:hypothetical protein